MDDTPSHQIESSRPSDALEVEKLDVNLYRSKDKQLWVPRRARGVFGGQVISQALVAATSCVDPGYALHVRSPLPSQRFYIKYIVHSTVSLILKSMHVSEIGL